MDRSLGTIKDMVWALSPAGREGRLAVVEQQALVFVGSLNRKVYALEARGGRKTYEFATGSAVGSAPAVWDPGLEAAHVPR